MPGRGAPFRVDRFPGMDLRGGDFGLSPWQMRTATNVKPINNASALVLRPPDVYRGAMTGGFVTGAGQLLGPFQVGSKLVAVYDANFAAPAVPDGVDEIWPFRAPGYVPESQGWYVPASQGWYYIGHTVLGTTLCVLMRWTAAVGGDNTIHLHVFDGKPGYATWVNGTGAPWLALTDTERAYVPRIGNAGGRVWISTPKGDVWFSAIGRPRIWWEKSSDDIAATGYEWIFPLTAGGTLPIPYVRDDLTNPDRWCGALVEVASVQNGATVWTPDAGTITWTAAGSYGTSSASTIPAWTVVAGLATVSGIVRIRVVPPTLGQGARRRLNRPTDIANYFEDRREVWTGDASATRWGTTQPLQFPVYDSTYVPAKPLVTLQASGSALVPEVEVAQQGTAPVVNQCIKAVRFQAHTAPAANQSITMTWNRVGHTIGAFLERTTVQCGGHVETINPTFIPFPADPAAPYDIYRLVYLTRQSGTGYRSGFVLATRTKDNVPLKPDDMYLGQIHDFDNALGSTGWAPFPSGFYADRSWDEARWVEVLDSTGDEDAGTLPSGQRAQTTTTQTVSCLVAVRNRLLVVYPSTIQLWRVDGAPSAMALLDTAAWGAGDQPCIRGVVDEQTAIFASSLGVAAVSVEGDLSERLNASDISGEIFGREPGKLGIPAVLDLALWPHLGALVVAATLPSDRPRLWLRFTAKDGKGLRWYRWDPPATEVSDIRSGSLHAIQDRLWYQPGSSTFLRCLDDAATPGSDTIPGGTQDYTGTIGWLYQHLGAPSRYKRWFAADVECQGSVGVTYTPLSTGAPVAVDAFTGNGYGRLPVPIMTTDTALAFDLTLAPIDGVASLRSFEVRARPFGR